MHHNIRPHRAGNGRLQQIVSSLPVYKPISTYLLIEHSLYWKGTNCQSLFYCLFLEAHNMYEGIPLVMTDMREHTTMPDIIKTNVNRFPSLKYTVLYNRRYSWISSRLPGDTLHKSASFQADCSVIRSTSLPHFKPIAR